MKRSTLLALAAIFPMIAAAASHAGDDARPSLVLVVPGRYAFVKMAQDLGAIRPVTVVSYSATNNASLFRWDPTAAKWSPLSAADFASGTGFDAASHLVVMGTDSATVGLFGASAKEWATKVSSFVGFDVVEVFNAANETLHFTRDEWAWLAGRYNLKFKDANEQRRRYGKYGPPADEKKAPSKVRPPVEDVVMPEAVSAPAPAPVSSGAPAGTAEPAKASNP